VAAPAVSSHASLAELPSSRCAPLGPQSSAMAQDSAEWQSAGMPRIPARRRSSPTTFSSVKNVSCFYCSQLPQRPHLPQPHRQRLALFGEEKRDVLLAPRIDLSRRSPIWQKKTPDTPVWARSRWLQSRGGGAALPSAPSGALQVGPRPGARRPRVCAAAAVGMLEAGRRSPCIFDPSHTYI
jgi:hypothetical protein